MEYASRYAFSTIALARDRSGANPPHFHAKYQKDKISVEIKDGKVRGEMSERALRLVLEWLDLHRDDLLAAWQQASAGIDPDPIEPLK